MNYDKQNKYLVIALCFIYGLITFFAIFILGISRVDAASFNTIGVREQDVSGNVNNYTNITNLTYPVTDTNTGSGLSRRRYIMYLSYNLTKSNSYSFDVNFKGTISYNGNSKNILNWPTSNVSLYWYDGTKEYPLTCSVTGTQDVTRAPIPMTGLDTIIKVYDVLVSCNDIKPSKDMTQVRIKYAFPSITAGSPVLTMQELIVVSKPTITSQSSLDTSAITSNNDANTQKIIENDNTNTEKITDAIDRQTESNQDINNSITDSNVDSNTGNSFFNSFNDIDHGGISGIITSPLNAINSMLNGTCTDLSGTWKGKTFTLPCGTQFWQQLGEIKTLMNITLGGILCYGIIRKLYLKIHELKNPEDDRVEVMSL